MTEQKTNANSDDRHWHLDKRVPLTLIFAIACQTVVAIWFGAQFANRVDHVEDEQAEIIKDIDEIDDALAARGERLATLEEGQKTIKDLLGRIDSKLDDLAK